MIYTIPGNKKPRWAPVPLNDTFRLKNQELLEMMAQKYTDLKPAFARTSGNWPEQDSRAAGDAASEAASGSRS